MTEVPLVKCLAFDDQIKLLYGSLFNIIISNLQRNI